MIPSYADTLILPSLPSFPSLPSRPSLQRAVSSGIKPKQEIERIEKHILKHIPVGFMHVVQKYMYCPHTILTNSVKVLGFKIRRPLYLALQGLPLNRLRYHPLRGLSGTNIESCYWYCTINEEIKNLESLAKFW